MITNTHTQDRPIRAVRRQRMGRSVATAFAAMGFVTICAYAAIGWLRGERSFDTSRVRIATVERAPLVSDITVDGRVTAASSPSLYAVAAGTVDLHVVAGDEVAKEQKLAYIASPELQSRLSQERATLAGLGAELERAEVSMRHVRATAQNRIEQAEVDKETADREFERLDRAYGLGAVAEIDVLGARARLHKAELELAHARQESELDEEKTRLELRMAVQAVDRQQVVVAELERLIDALIIRSPVDGQVGQVLVPQSAYVAVNTAVLTVVDLTDFEVEIKMPESFARDLKIGMASDIRVANRPYAGRVLSVSPEVVNGEVTGRLAFAGEPPAGLRQNQRVSARVVLREIPSALIIERGPSLDSGSGPYAYVVDRGMAERRPIRTGVASLNHIEILAGAEVGDRIVISGADLFGDVERVRLAGE